jgi:hypothetical protein
MSKRTQWLRYAGLACLTLGVLLWGIAVWRASKPGNSASVLSTAHVSEAMHFPELRSPSTEVLSSTVPVVPHRNLPASLADFPRTKEFAKGVEWYRWKGYGLNAESLLDFKLRFLNRLETCVGSFPSTGEISYAVTFNPTTDSNGDVTGMGDVARAVVKKSSGLDAGELAALTDCARVAYGMQWDAAVLPAEPEFHLFLGVKFPLDENSFPYKLLRTGVQ